MKHLFAGVILLLTSLLTPGCATKWPNNAYIKDAKSTINTPWGPSTIEAAVIATGDAAKNLTDDDRKPTPKVIVTTPTPVRP